MSVHPHSLASSGPGGVTRVAVGRCQAQKEPGLSASSEPAGICRREARLGLQRHAGSLGPCGARQRRRSHLKGLGPHHGRNCQGCLHGAPHGTHLLPAGVLPLALASSPPSGPGPSSWASSSILLLLGGSGRGEAGTRGPSPVLPLVCLHAFCKAVAWSGSDKDGPILLCYNKDGSPDGILQHG